MWIAALLVAVLALLLGQDSTAVVPATAPWYAIGALALWQVVGPVISSWVFKKWTAIQAKLHGVGKQVAYTIFATFWLLVPQSIGMLLDKSPDNWMQAGFLDLLTAVATSLIYKWGTKPNAPLIPVSASAKRTRRPNGSPPPTTSSGSGNIPGPAV